MPHTITDKCIGCTLCARNCPVKAINGKVKQKHEINPLRCVDCGVCGRVCNVSAILDQNGQPTVKVPKKEWLHPEVDEKLCSACAICVRACGKDCLSISLPKFKGDIHVFAYLKEAKQCVGCNQCAIYCPLHAITMKGGEPQ